MVTLIDVVAHFALPMVWTNAGGCPETNELAPTEVVPVIVAVAPLTSGNVHQPATNVESSRLSLIVRRVISCAVLHHVYRRQGSRVEHFAHFLVRRKSSLGGF